VGEARWLKPGAAVNRDSLGVGLAMVGVTLGGGGGAAGSGGAGGAVNKVIDINHLL